MNSIKVLFANKKYNYETNVSATSTKEDVECYFVGRAFDLGQYPKEDYQICTGVIFTDNNLDKNYKIGKPLTWSKLPTLVISVFGQDVALEGIREANESLIKTLDDITSTKQSFDQVLNLLSKAGYKIF